ncbi:N-acetylneuraminate synthase [Solidesulfovibrio sp.]|uniref:N-acetylneuraminate synthase n=1 Tax=Solidesulfovibrio sp. TaxID=2910990 RepID=UPI002B1EA6BC|nr:N-acetylneuraminate synthase [Solidesulfovibrio sp.]MEA5088410.1 N-acetylneuraminate synthase [Solidesulfovibrio sp.]
MRVTIIAEAGVNHNGSLEMALRLVDAAADAGADAVKFQTFVAAAVVCSNAAKAEYQQLTTGAQESQLEMIRKLELGPEDFDALRCHCRERGIEFLSTPFDLQSLDLLLRLGVSRLKLPSGEITNGPFLLAAARAGLPLLLSTGMSGLGEVETALGVLAFGLLEPRAEPGPEDFALALASPAGQERLRDNVTLLHCTTEYPAPLADVNLRAMATLEAAFGLPVGYSDHTKGITVPVAAAALGARVLEKHLTLDNALPGPDHKASLDPAAFKDMVAAVREVELCLGDGRKRLTPCERGNRAVARRSLVAARPIRAGEPFSPENLTAKRPGTGRSPLDYWSLLGRPADRNYDPDEGIA